VYWSTDAVVTTSLVKVLPATSSVFVLAPGKFRTPTVTSTSGSVPFELVKLTSGITRLVNTNASPSSIPMSADSMKEVIGLGADLGSSTLSTPSSCL
jgi:hypothetical protein